MTRCSATECSFLLAQLHGNSALLQSVKREVLSLTTHIHQSSRLLEERRRGSRWCAGCLVCGITLVHSTHNQDIKMGKQRVCFVAVGMAWSSRSQVQGHGIRGERLGSYTQFKGQSQGAH